MSTRLDRPGLFKARLASWGLKEAKSGAVAVNIEFIVTAQYADGEWQDWTQYGDYFVFGDFWVVGKSGLPNESAVKQLVECLAWTGDLRDISQAPPAVIVQILVNEEEYEGKTYIKATWMNPEDHVPGPNHLDDGEVAQLNNRFGSMLRASASAARAAIPAAANPATSGAAAKAPGAGASGAAPKPPEPPAPTDDDLPY